MRVRPTEKLFLTVNPQKILIFVSLYFCGLFSDGTPSEKYFSDGIRIFPWIFAHTEKKERFQQCSLSCTKLMDRSCREINFVSKFIHMMNGARGINAGQRMYAMFIHDSRSPFHCFGDGSLFPGGYTQVPPDLYIYGASGKRKCESHWHWVHT